jgi:hypothetical protein
MKQAYWQGRNYTITTCTSNPILDNVEMRISNVAKTNMLGKFIAIAFNTSILIYLFFCL